MLKTVAPPCRHHASWHLLVARGLCYSDGLLFVSPGCLDILLPDFVMKLSLLTGPRPQGRVVKPSLVEEGTSQIHSVSSNLQKGEATGRGANPRADIARFARDTTGKYCYMHSSVPCRTFRMSSSGIALVFAPHQAESGRQML